MEQDRRAFITGTGIVLASVCAGVPVQAGEAKVRTTPVEDLEQEHGLIQRLLLIYDEGVRRITGGQDFDPKTVYDAAGIMRRFVEDYHEKQEEEFLFPRFEKAHHFADLSQTLKTQHDAGRKLTAQIWDITKAGKLTDGGKALVDTLTSFTRMYRVHAAREDTVLFPALRKLVSPHEYDAMGEEFEKKEQAMFGKDGFDAMLDKVADIEKKLGIYELGQFTPS